MSGAIEPLTDFSEFKYNESTEGEKSLSFYIHKTENNEPVFDLIVNKEKIEFDDDKYTIDVCDREPIGTTIEKYIEARHEMFDRLKGEFIEEEYTGALRIERCLDIALKGTGLTYEVIGTFTSRDFENFGRAKGLALFQTIINRFGVEYRVHGTHLIIATAIGNVTDAQFRHAHNLKSISEHIDTTDLATFIKGYSYNDETGELLAYAEYESPYSHLYKDEHGNKRLIHADYVYDNRFRHNSEMLTEIKSRLKDAPEYNLQITYEELKNNGFKLHHYQLGDYVWSIYEPLGLDIQARIISIESYPYDPHLSPVIQLGSFRRDITKTVSGLQGTAKRVDAAEGEIVRAISTASRAQVTADEAKQAVDNSGTTLTQHINDYVRHVTELERSNWNNKAGSGDVQSVLQLANSYTDGQVEQLEGVVNTYTDEQVAPLFVLIDTMQIQIMELTQRVSNLEGG